MAESNFPLPEEIYCSLCADTLRDPVTIPCGDTYCLECIKVYWDQFEHIGVYSCPQCHATFTPRPVLRRNLPDVNHEPRRQLPELTPFPYMHRESFCDFCVGRRNKAVKSCLMCLAYYCETHVKPHYESSTFKRHKLVDETGHLDRKICPQHEKGLELFCRSDQMCICVLCTVREHRSHNITSAEEERIEKQVSCETFVVNNFCLLKPTEIFKTPLQKPLYSSLCSSIRKFWWSPSLKFSISFRRGWRSCRNSSIMWMFSK